MTRALVLAASVFFVMIILPGRAYSQGGELVPPQRQARWNIWLGEGPAQVFSSNSSLGNHFQIGAETQFLDQHRMILGITAIDLLSSGEESTDVGQISRYGFDLRAGYFLLPDKLFIEYGLYLGQVHGSNIMGWDTTVGQNGGLGWRFYSQNQFNMTLEAEYQFICAQTVSTYNPLTGNFGSGTYPRASVVSLNLRVGFDPY